MLDDEDADPLIANLADHFDHVFNLDLIETRHDFIAQKNLRLHCQRLRQLEPLAAGPPQFVGALIDISGQSDELQLSAGLLAGFRHLGLSASPSEQCAHGDVVQDR